MTDDDSGLVWSMNCESYGASGYNAVAYASEDKGKAAPQRQERITPLAESRMRLLQMPAEWRLSL